MVDEGYPNLKKQIVNPQLARQQVISLEEEGRRDLDKELKAREKVVERKERKVEKLKKEEKPVGKFKFFRQFVSGKYKKLKPISDRLKVLRFQNRLEKMRLQNQINRLRLTKRIQSMRIKGILPIPKTMLPPSPIMPLYPAYATPEVIGDIDSVWKADIGTGESLFGNEGYFLANDYYDEDFYGTEFDNTPEEHLGLNFRRGSASPLLY